MDKYSLIQKLEGHHNDVVACEFSPDGALLATASYDTRICVWDPYIGVILMEFGWVNECDWAHVYRGQDQGQGGWRDSGICPALGVAS